MVLDLYECQDLIVDRNLIQRTAIKLNTTGNQKERNQHQKTIFKMESTLLYSPISQ